LSEREAAIWNRFIAKYPDAFTQQYFDVCIGEARPTTEKLNDATLKNRAYLGKYKIDVIGETDDFLTIIEIKHEATSKALGEVWLYDHLFRQYYDGHKIILNAIVTDTEMPHMREITKADGIQLYVV